MNERPRIVNPENPAGIHEQEYSPTAQVYLKRDGRPPNGFLKNEHSGRFKTGDGKKVKGE